MAESVDAPDLKSVGHYARESSSLSVPIINIENMDDLKIYCHTQEDQSIMFDFLFEIYRNNIEYCTWEPDGDIEQGGESEGTWGMFIDNFPYPELWDKVVEFLESEDSWALEDDVEMALGDGTISYPPLTED